MSETKFYDQIFSTIYYATGVIGIPANILLLLLIVFKTPDSLRVYRVLLFNACVTDLVFGISSTLAQIRIIPNRWYFAYVSLGPARYLGKAGAPFSYEMYTMQLHSIFYTFLCFPISFGFRYFVLVRPIPRARTLVHLCLALWGIAIAQHIMFHFSQMAPDDVRTKLQAARPEYNLTDLVISGNYHMLEHPLVTVVLCTIILPMFPIYLLVIFFYYKIDRFLLDHASQMRVSIVTDHRKLLRALSLQVSLPVLFVFPPIGLYLLYHLEFVRCTLFEYLVFPIFSFYPATAPFITMYYTRPYRSYIVRRLFLRARSNVASTCGNDYPTKVLQRVTTLPSDQRIIFRAEEAT